MCTHFLPSNYAPPPLSLSLQARAHVLDYTIPLAPEVRIYALQLCSAGPLIFRVNRT